MARKKSEPGATNPGTQQPESFEATARRMLEQALTLFPAERSLATREIQECVRFLVAHAKGRGLQVERMIIELKQVCHGSESTAQEKSEVISRLVTMCIREFYGAEPVDP